MCDRPVLGLLAALACIALAPLVATGHGGATEAGAPGTPPLALTPAEYNNTIADLLGLPRDGEQWPERSALADRLSPRRTASKGVFLPPPPPPVWPWRFPAEPGSEGFEGIVQGQSPSSYQVEELHLAAMHFASFVFDSPTFFTCDGWAAQPAAQQEACAWSSIERFARRAYRRPLRSEEPGRIEAFWLANLAAYPRDEAVALTVAGVLQAPPFHFRVEPSAGSDGNGTVQPSQWELATRLSYFLWDSMPDEALFAAAETGRLATAEEIERQARRMLDDPKARPAIVHFHHQWLGTDQVLLVAPARRAFGPLFGLAPELETARDDDVKWPAVMGPVRHSMKLETELFVEQTIFDGAGTFSALMTDNHGYMSDATKPIYGDGATRIEDEPTVTRPIELVVASIGRKQDLTLYRAEFPRTERAGVLTLPSVLALGAYAVQPGPILRGKRVLERIACMELGLPIQGAEAALPPDTLTAESTNRERTATATSPALCNTCHRMINPPGFAFEHYDAIGKWRAEDNGQPVDASGTLALTGGEEITFTDGIDFVRQLANSDRVRDCYVEHWTRYALGTQLGETPPGLEALQERFREEDSIKELLVSIASSDLFRMRPAAAPSGANQ
ncbi:MAG: DUF1592 domain-containing protein [Vicinamibacterales bacterium]|jgi:hypothetical protein|nr:DUF1592 domain-containing protein [Vicinamibacterales bacterium]